MRISRRSEGRDIHRPGCRVRRGCVSPTVRPVCSRAPATRAGTAPRAQDTPNRPREVRAGFSVAQTLGQSLQFVEALRKFQPSRPFEAMACSIPLTSGAPWDERRGPVRSPAPIISSRPTGATCGQPAARCCRDPDLAASCGRGAADDPGGGSNPAAHRIDELFANHTQHLAPGRPETGSGGRRMKGSAFYEIEPICRPTGNGAATFYRGILKALAGPRLRDQLP